MKEFDVGCESIKKLMVFVLALICILALCSCGWNSQNAVATVFSENVTKVDITHRIGTGATHWSIEGTEIETLREWYNKLNYKVIEVKEGQVPGDVNGNEVYTFEFTGGEWLGFSYVINGDNDCYILNPEGNWFAVTNPSDPPITAVCSFHAKVLEVHDNYLLVEHLPDGKTLSVDKIEIPLEEKTSWPIPAVGDNVEVYYDGTIMETYPAKLNNVYRVEILTIKLTS